MATPGTAEDMHADIARLAHGVDVYRAWRIALHRQAFGTDPAMTTIVEPGHVFTDVLGDAPDRSRLRFVLDELRMWYDVTGNELSDIMRGSAEAAAEVRAFLDQFRAEACFGFFEAGGMVQRTAEKVLTRGRVATRDEWYKLADLANLTDQKILTAEETARLQGLLADYEAAQ